MIWPIVLPPLEGEKSGQVYRPPTPGGRALSSDYPSIHANVIT